VRNDRKPTPAAVARKIVMVCAAAGVALPMALAGAWGSPAIGASAASMSAASAPATGASPAGASAAGAPGTGLRGEFIVRCPMTGEVEPVDPIMDPAGKPGHNHMFFGHYEVKATSTANGLRRQGASSHVTTCQDVKDTSAYWAPESFLNGKPFLPGCKRRPGGSGDYPGSGSYVCGTDVNTTIYVRAYYLTTAGQSTRRLPPGLMMVVGTPDATSAPTTMSHVYWDCGATTVKTPQGGREEQTAKSIWPYTCDMFHFPDDQGLTEIIDYPSCWDGKASFKTPNGTGMVAGYIDHAISAHAPNDLAYRPAGGCRALDRKGVTYQAVPHLSLRIHYTGLGLGSQTPGGADTLSTNSTPIYPSSCTAFHILPGCHTQAQEGLSVPPHNIGLKLSADPAGAPGPWYTGHADYWQTWQQGKALGPGKPYGTLNSLTYYCLDLARICSFVKGVPYPGQIPA
jgi:Domain of unknown function (DUF1996)